MKKQTKAQKTKKPKLRKIGRVIKDADAWYSRFIRERDNNICYTCGKQLSPKDSQCGHLIPRNDLEFKYNEDNTFCQCYMCNVIKKGNYIPYTLKMILTYGFDKIMSMWVKHTKNEEVIDGKQIYKLKMSREDYEAIITKYKSKYENLINSKQNDINKDKTK